MHSTAAERRTHPRYRLKTGSFAYYALGQAAIRDLSLAGVFIEDRQNKFPEGTELALELRLENETIPLQGTVCRCAPNVGFAVRFQDIHRSTKERLDKHFRNKFGPSKAKQEQ